MSTHIKERVVGMELAETRNSDNAGGDLARRSRCKYLFVCPENRVVARLQLQPVARHSQVAGECDSKGVSHM